jgi:hypothetical protein
MVDTVRIWRAEEATVCRRNSPKIQWPFEFVLRAYLVALSEEVRLKCGSGCGTDGVKMRNGTDMGLKCGTDMGLKRGTERIWG